VPWLENRSRNAVSSARVIETKMIFERKKKKRKEAKVQEGTDGVGKHFFLDVLSEDGTLTEKNEAVGGKT